MANVYQMVTDRIIEQMNKGIVPWHQPWIGGSAMAISYTTRKAYSMLNQLLLGSSLRELQLILHGSHGIRSRQRMAK